MGDLSLGLAKRGFVRVYTGSSQWFVDWGFGRSGAFALSREFVLAPNHPKDLLDWVILQHAVDPFCLGFH